MVRVGASRKINHMARKRENWQKKTRKMKKGIGYRSIF